MARAIRGKHRQMFSAERSPFVTARRISGPSHIQRTKSPARQAAAYRQAAEKDARSEGSRQSCPTSRSAISASAKKIHEMMESEMVCAAFCHRSPARRLFARCRSARWPPHVPARASGRIFNARAISSNNEDNDLKFSIVL